MTQIVTELPPGISKSHDVATRIEVLIDGVVERVLDEVTTGTVTLSLGADARARMSMTAVGIGDLIPVDESGPLNVYGTELALYRGMETPVDTYLVQLGVFGIDRSTASDDGGSIDVAVSGRDRAGRFMAPEGSFETAGQIDSGTMAGAAILEVLLDSWPGMPYDADAFAALDVPLPTVAWDEGEDRWAFAAGIAVACRCELYFDRTGSLTVQLIPELTSGTPTVADLVAGDGGTLLNIERDWDRSRVINRWTVFGENPSNDPNAAIPYGVAVDDNFNSPTYYYGANVSGKTFGRRLDSTHNSFVGTDVQAADMAGGLLAKTIGRPDSISFGAITDPARDPLDVVFVERSTLGIESNQILDTVNIPLDAEGDMSGETRITQVLA